MLTNKVRSKPQNSLIVLIGIQRNYAWMELTFLLNKKSLFKNFQPNHSTAITVRHRVIWLRYIWALFGQVNSKCEFLTLSFLLTQQNTYLAAKLSSRNSVQSLVKALFSKKVKTRLNVSRLASRTSDSKSLTCNNKLTMVRLGWFSVGICKYKPGYKSHDLL